MKKTILILLFVICYSLYTKNDWVKLSFDLSGEVVSMNCLNFKDCKMLFTYTGGEIQDYGWRLYKTTNKGSTFKLLYKEKSPFEQDPPGVMNAFSGVSPHPNYYFIASYDNSVIIKSTDEGKSFKKIILDGSGKPMRSLAMYDSLTGFVFNQNNVFVTRDGWETFKTIPKLNINQSYYSSQFKDSNNVYVIYSNPFVDTLGQSFAKYNLNGFVYDTVFYFGVKIGYWADIIKDICFINDSLGFVCGYRGYRENGKADDDIILKTTNGGYHWEIVLLEAHAPQYGLSDIAFYDENNGFAVGNWGKIIMTNDGGKTWQFDELYNVPILKPVWAGRTPLIGTAGHGIYRYEGDFFKFPPDTAKIQTEDMTFGKYNIESEDSLKKKMIIMNDAEDAELKIFGYSKLNTDAFTTNLPEVDSLHPIVIQAQEYFEYEVYFKPKLVQQYKDSIIFYSNAKKTDNVAYLTGEGVAFPSIQAENYNYGTKEIHDTTMTTKKIKIHNQSYADLQIFGFSDLTESAFTNEFVWNDSMAVLTVKPLSYFELPVSFKPTEMRKYKDSIIVHSNASKQDSIILLEGEGIDSTIGVVDDLITNYQLLITPNPAGEYIEITFLNHRVNPMVHRYEIAIYNVLGESVFSNPQYLIPNPNTQYPNPRIEISSLPAGVYLVVINDGILITKVMFIKS